MIYTFSPIKILSIKLATAYISTSTYLLNTNISLYPLTSLPTTNPSWFVSIKSIFKFLSYDSSPIPIDITILEHKLSAFDHNNKRDPGIDQSPAVITPGLRQNTHATHNRGVTV